MTKFFTFGRCIAYDELDDIRYTKIKINFNVNNFILQGIVT